MLDVVHYLFEEDNHYVSEESAKSRSGLRMSMFSQMYGTTYKYEYRDSSATASNQFAVEDSANLGADDLPAPFNPKQNQPPKAFVPATDFDPEAAVPFAGLDAPLN